MTEQAGQARTPTSLSHLDESGHIHMVDVSDKDVTTREAVARARLRMLPETVRLIETNQITKGSVLEVAKIAGIMAAKKTPELIPLCHPLPMTHIDIQFSLDSGQGIVTIETRTRVTYKTGVEVEALTAAMIAAVTIYDMVKAVDHTVTLERAYIARKSGGRSGVVEFEPENS